MQKQFKIVCHVFRVGGLLVTGAEFRGRGNKAARRALALHCQGKIKACVNVNVDQVLLRGGSIAHY